MGRQKNPSKAGLTKKLDILWSKIVRDKYDHKCAVCGSTPVQAHHIFTRTYKSTRWDIENGIALCYKHHFFLAHSRFEEFRDFLIEHMGQEKYDELKQHSNNLVKVTREYLLETQEILSSFDNK